MDLSDIFPHSNQSLCKWSPNGKYIASTMQYRVIVREANTQEISHLFACIEEVSFIAWSPDSLYILCGMYKRAVIQIWSLEHPEWTCKIDEGPAGISNLFWSPDSRNVISISEFQIRLSVWSLVNKSVTIIKNPKYSNQAMSFSNNKKFFAFVERKESKDIMHVYLSENWSPISQFKTDTLDLADFVWTPNDHALCVWDTCLEYKIFLYNPMGKCLHQYSAYEQALGIKSVSWSPSGELLAIGSYDQQVRLINSMNWKLVTELQHHPIIVPGTSAIYREIQDEVEVLQSKYVLEDKPTVIPQVKPTEKFNPKIGVGSIKWSADNRYIFTKNDNMPNTLFIWEVAKLELTSVLIQKEPIKAARWDPVEVRLVISTGTEMIFIWTPEGCSSIRIAPNFNIHSLNWNPNGSSVCLIDKTKFSVVFFQSEQSEF